MLFVSDIRISGCISYCDATEWGYSYGEFDSYNVNATKITTEGILFDPSDQNISPQLIDRLTNEVNNCLMNTFPNKSLPNDIITTSYCKQIKLPLPIDKTSFVVKIANDWVFSCDKTQQLLPTPVKAGGEGCISKGLTPNENCPCRWRAGIKCPNILITPPSFYLYKDILIRFITKCANPWNSAELAFCATPSTTPLSNGSDIP